MWKVTIKGLLAHKLRLALTALAIVLGVTFISGTLVLTDTLHNTFTTLFGHVYQNVDFEVRGKAAFTATRRRRTPSATRSPSRSSPRSADVPGVAYAEGTVTGYAQFVAPDGKAISTGGAPTIGSPSTPTRSSPRSSWPQGTAPTTPTRRGDGRRHGRQKYHFSVGDHVRILLPGPPQTFTITGIVKFGTADNLAGATIAAFDLPTAQKLFDLSGQLRHHQRPGHARAPTRPPCSTPSPGSFQPGSRS